VLAPGLLLAAAAGGGAGAAEGPPYLLHEGTRVCESPPHYDEAVAEQAKTNGYKDLMALKDRLLEAKLCMYVDDDDIKDMMALRRDPRAQQRQRHGISVGVLEREGGRLLAR
jgi:hypothetical protein